MCSYCGSKNYYKIYINHHGLIPTEADGRTYEIHHIDGNHNNNDPSNLIAITLQEHYNIHYAQGDFSACQLMAIQRMSKTPQEISTLATLSNLQRVIEGKHHFVGGQIQKRVTSQRLSSGTHNWQKRTDGSSHATDKVSKGQHPWQKRSDGTSFSGDNVKNGKCPLLKRSDGTSIATDQLKNGTHASLFKWTCINCKKSGSGKGNYTRYHSLDRQTSCHYR